MLLISCQGEGHCCTGCVPYSNLDDHFWAIVIVCIISYIWCLNLILFYAVVLGWKMFYHIRCCGVTITVVVSSVIWYVQHFFRRATQKDCNGVLVGTSSLRHGAGSFSGDHAGSSCLISSSGFQYPLCFYESYGRDAPQGTPVGLICFVNMLLCWHQTFLLASVSEVAICIRIFSLKPSSGLGVGY